MLEKIFWLIIGIILSLYITKSKPGRMALIGLFILTFLDGILFSGFYTQLLILTPVFFVNNFMIGVIEGMLLMTYEIVDLLVIGTYDLLLWSYTPTGSFWVCFTALTLFILVDLLESISKIPKVEV